jgi:Sap, sulfolipid-1-addressing protein
VTIEAIVLAAVSAIRPSTSFAALYALLSTSHPRRLIVVFVAAGFTASMLVGVSIVAVFHGSGLRRGGSTVSEVVDVAAGILLLGFAAAVQRGWVDPARRTGTRQESGPLARLRAPSARMAGVAGVLTHLPGLFYLVSLTAIADGEPTVLRAVADVAAYNVIWFSLPIAAAVLVHRHPEELRARIDRTTASAQRHSRPLVCGGAALVGLFLVVKGAAGLLG